MRAAPTAQLIAVAGRAAGAVWVHCFPLPRIVAEQAVRLRHGAASGGFGVDADGGCDGVLLRTAVEVI